MTLEEIEKLMVSVRSYDPDETHAELLIDTIINLCETAVELHKALQLFMDATRSGVTMTNMVTVDGRINFYMLVSHARDRANLILGRMQS